jgi:hypothetical protein
VVRRSIKLGDVIWKRLDSQCPSILASEMRAYGHRLEVIHNRRRVIMVDVKLDLGEERRICSKFEALAYEAYL